MRPPGRSADAADELVERVRARARGAREGLFGPGSAFWTVARENLIFAGAPRALLLQLAHPAVLSGVAQHSRVASDPMGRSVRTFEAMYTLGFGDLDGALRVARAVWRRHEVVRGRITDATRPPLAGAPYHATDPDLLRWVWATLEDTMVRTFEALVRPLSAGERARFHEDGKLMQLAFGVPESALLPTPAAFDAYVQDTLAGPLLDVTAGTREQWEILLRQPPSSGLSGALMLPRSRAVTLLLDGSPARLLAPSMARLLAAGSLPPRLREGYGLRWSRVDAALHGAIVAATRAGLARLPAALRYHAAYRRAAWRMAHPGASCHG